MRNYFHLCSVIACTAIPNTCWTPKKGRVGNAGYRRTVKDFVGYCQLACLKEIWCVAIDWKPKSKKNCLLYKFSDTRAATATEKALVRHYEVNQRCWSRLSLVSIHLHTPTCRAFVPINPMNARMKFEVRSFNRS